ncbi:MAG: hypothetical protein BWY62_01004 [Firmicutes bacterium ADurb.Bin356]|nr:MAG: hypothetical protein BWY62_01004 [Firmicutes bacterium ADurb.Bin356]
MCSLHGGGELEIGTLRQQGWSLYADIQSYMDTLAPDSLDYHTLRQFEDALYDAILNESSAQSLAYIIFETKQEFERVRG